MVRVARSVCLKAELWIRIEKYQRNHRINNFSEAVKELVERGLKNEK